MTECLPCIKRSNETHKRHLKMTKKAEIPTKKGILKWTYRRNYIIISPHLSGMIEHIAKATFLG